MGTAKKYKNHYPSDKDNEQQREENTLDDKRQIEAYLQKISQLLKDDPEMQKKAALIISQLINSSKK